MLCLIQRLCKSSIRCWRFWRRSLYFRFSSNGSLLQNKELRSVIYANYYCFSNFWGSLSLLNICYAVNSVQTQRDIRCSKSIIWNIRFEVFTAVKISMVVFWVMTYGLGNRYQHFRGTYCIHLQDWGEYRYSISLWNVGTHVQAQMASQPIRPKTVINGTKSVLLFGETSTWAISN